MSKVVVLVTHYNRPHALARSMPQLRALGAPIVVVDDGSDDEAFALASKHLEGVNVIPLPQNRGLAAALNAGLAYILADSSVEWISYAQDDVDIRPDALDVLEFVADHSRVTPLLMTGHDAAEHQAVTVDRSGPYEIKLKRSCRGTHMHATADYWRSVLPIPTRKLGAPCRDQGPGRGTGSNADWWICRDSPNSVAQKGQLVMCVPGLVRTFLHEAQDSTWNNPAPEEPPLAEVRA